MDKGKLLMIIIIVLLVLLLGTIGAVSFIAFNKLGSMNGTESVTETAQPGETAAVSLKAADITAVPLSTPITTNLLKGEDGKDHLIKVDISLGVNNTDKKLSPEVIAMFTEKEPIVRDICYSIIRNTTYEEFLRPDGQELLKESIRIRLSEEFDTTFLVAIYFSDIVLP